MKKIISLFFALVAILVFSGCASSNQQTQSESVQPENIDKHNVGITSSEKPDQTDPTLIEGNLEDNDFKN